MIWILNRSILSLGFLLDTHVVRPFLDPTNYPRRGLLVLPDPTPHYVHHWEDLGVATYQKSSIRRHICNWGRASAIWGKFYECFFFSLPAICTVLLSSSCANVCFSVIYTGVCYEVYIYLSLFLRCYIKHLFLINHLK